MFTRRSAANEARKAPFNQNQQYSQNPQQYNRNFVKSYVPAADNNNPSVAGTNTPNISASFVPQSAADVTSTQLAAPPTPQSVANTTTQPQQEPQSQQQAPSQLQSTQSEQQPAVVKVESNEDMMDVEKLRNEHFQKWREARKKAGLSVKVNKKLKKKRLNAKLEKVLKPKNAFLIFNELNLKPEYNIQENTQRPGYPRTYSAHLTLDGRMYTGEGVSIAGAKMVAADIALKDWFSRYLKKPEAATGTTDKDLPAIKMETEDDDVDGTAAEKDPAPWSAVGSYAMHLLFTRWQMDMNSATPQIDCPPQNTEIPKIATNAPNFNTPKAAKIVSELVDYTAPATLKFPPNPEQCQPLYVFNLAFPNVPFVEKVDDSNVEERFQVQCKVNGAVYVAKARNKKEARRQLAIQVLKFFGLNFVQPQDKTQQNATTKPTPTLTSSA